MNKLLLVSTVVLGLSAMNVQAAEPVAVNGGFVGPTINVSTVEQVKAMRDDTKVTMQGNIDSHLGGEDYLFRDKTGTIKVEIDHEEWNGQQISPTDIVEIRGEVDKGWKSIEIDVDSIAKLKK